jgi:hypothetical protein
MNEIKQKISQRVCADMLPFLPASAAPERDRTGGSF